MRTAISLLVLLVSVWASANPYPAWPQVFIDFDEDGIPDPEIVSAITPAPYTTFSAYVGLGCNDMPGREFTTISFMLSNPMVECPGVFAPPSFVNLLPGDLAIGTWDTGISLASTECMQAPVVFLCRLDLFYLGGECCIRILDHPQFPRWVVDCQEPGQVWYYCVENHGSVGGAYCPPGEDCWWPTNCGVTAVENVSWGAVKSLYR